MADKQDKQKHEDRFTLESWAGVIGSLSLVSILVVIIGRLWTRTYFDHFGLPSSGMEFTIYDFAFRSLEALISLLLGAVGFSLAWLNRRRLADWGFKSALVELAIVGALCAWVLIGLPQMRPSVLATTGILGLSSGLLLGAMLWFSVDIWQGPGGGVDKWPSWAKTPAELAYSRLPPSKQMSLETVMPGIWKVIAVVLVLAIGFAYVPSVSQRLAAIEAEADLATRSFSAAILESKDPLPEAIRSSADATRSIPVRVILTQSQNTYVLHSTDCKTIGELTAPVSISEFLPMDAPDVCKVFSIPTERLNSIEYFQVSGREPPNQSLLRPIEVGLNDDSIAEPYSNAGASDETAFLCDIRADEAAGQEEKDPGHDGAGDEPETDFYKSIWFEFEPASDGAVFGRVEAADFEPSIGIWQAPPEGSTELVPIAGSGSSSGLACETRSRRVSETAANGATEPSRKNVVGAVANVQAGVRYVAAVGSRENKGGQLNLAFDFTAGGLFFDSAGGTGEESRTLQVQVPSGRARIILELWELNRREYSLEPYDGDPGRFELIGVTEFVGSDGVLPATSIPFSVTRQDSHEQPVFAIDDIQPGTWTLDPPESFTGLATLVPTMYPDLVFTFTNTATAPLNSPCIQRALLRALDGLSTELAYAGRVVFEPQGFGDRCERTSDLHELLEEEALGDGFPIQIQVEQDREALHTAAEKARDRLIELGLDAVVAPCRDACIRVFHEVEAPQ